ncbi:MAG: hypothetical protein DBX58_06285 [Clostridiales bacterium]|nr:MAG: hypothetical protein DBX58_06285 [Clostridiales bacterium]
MRIEDAYGELEKYYDEVYTYNTDSNSEEYDLDKECEKRWIRKILDPSYIINQKDIFLLNTIARETSDIRLSEAIMLICKSAQSME